MDAATVTALGALLASLVTGAAAAYGSRGATRAAREGGALTGFSSLTNELQEERKELRSDVAALRAELAAEKAETTRLRMLVTQLGGTP
jgi:NADP-dependent 3-hydroxy acid dehydrogenase YdfG